MQLSPHFTLEEMIASDTARRKGWTNIPEDADAKNLLVLCTTLLEPVRELLGTPLKINSGYRSPQLNAAVGGVLNSAHMEGRAADFVTPQMDLNVAFEKIAQSKMQWDQLIWEWNKVGSQWIHIAIPRDGEKPRRQVLKMQHRPQRRAIS